MSYGNDFTYTGSGLITTASNAHLYKAPIIAQLLHTLPRFNITFHRTNNTFRLRDEKYLESLGILGSVPAALLIVSLFGLLLYLMTRCCDRKPRTAHSITSLKVTLSVVTVLCCAAIGLGLYGNDDLHNGLLEVLTAGRKVDNLVSSVRNQTTTLEMTLSNRIRPQLVELEDIFDQPTLNQTALKLLISSLNVVQGNVTIANNAAGDIRRPLVGINMAAVLNKGDQWELIRWPGTVAVLALLLVLCAVLLVGVARHSRCALILFSVCGLLAVTGSWLMSGLYLSSSVAVADLCIDPAGYLASEAPNELPTDVLLYYTQCEEGNINPFTLRLRESQNAINNARSAMTIVSRISTVLFKAASLQPKIGAVTADLNTCERLLTQLTALVDCKAVYFNYMNASRGLCEGGLLGLVLMLAASFIAAILLTIMVWVDSHTWIYIRKRNEYSQVEEPSYVSHQPLTLQQQQQQQQINHYHATMSRTLPRNMNGPPVISGSHTLSHAGRKQHEMMMAQQHGSATMRPMRHQHHHHPAQGGGSPHMGPGPNNAAAAAALACSVVDPQQQQQHLQALQAGQQQLPPMTAQQHQEYMAAMQKYAQQHQNYHNQQMAAGQYQQQQQHPQLQPAHPPHHQHHYSDGHQIQLMTQQQQQQQLPPNGQHMINNGAMTMRRYQTMQRPPQNSTGRAAPLNPNNTNSNNNMMISNHNTMGRGPPANQQQQQQMMVNQNNTSSNKNDIPIPSSNVDSALYERDKQIYKCSTLRQGGRFDSSSAAAAAATTAAKPSILNCPLPDIPREQHQQQQQPPLMDNVGRQCKTMQRTHPHAKAIPPPRIVSPPKLAVAPVAPDPADVDLPPPPPLRLDESSDTNSNDLDSSRTTQLSTGTSSSPTSSTATIIHQHNSLSQSSLTNSIAPPPPPPLITDDCGGGGGGGGGNKQQSNGGGGSGGGVPNDDNYAVTEL